MAVRTPEGGRPVSRDEHDALPEDPRVEHVDGHLLASPSPTRWHQELCVDLLLDVAALPGPQAHYPGSRTPPTDDRSTTPVREDQL
ncbi:hypothetical protein MN205_12260 [Kineococcus sp. TRM81007]|uniref:hypothetical protein n=1 Tax=Kineococcus sp. TRM81007 TaxID=2925831 RepID=UPI001F585140|nr:hypothetical protein [Kineococcus sp. TRM81007]MCI2239261.1 hypothetical protein [Kineococcus sp. TRM81007]